jgi:hypothetical protein
MDWTRAYKRADGLDVNELSDGYVIYQQSADRVHYLNGTAVVVFELCNGETTADRIPDLLKGVYELTDPPTAEVEQCLARLLDEGLLQPA